MGCVGADDPGTNTGLVQWRRCVVERTVKSVCCFPSYNGERPEAVLDDPFDVAHNAQWRFCKPVQPHNAHRCASGDTAKRLIGSHRNTTLGGINTESTSTSESLQWSSHIFTRKRCSGRCPRLAGPYSVPAHPLGVLDDLGPKLLLDQVSATSRNLEQGGVERRRAENVHMVGGQRAAAQVKVLGLVFVLCGVAKLATIVRFRGTARRGYGIAWPGVMAVTQHRKIGRLNLQPCAAKDHRAKILAALRVSCYGPVWVPACRVPCVHTT